MKEYIVYRHSGEPPVEGETLANHDKRPVARLFASDAKEACRFAAEQVSLTEGQWLSADPATEVDAKVNKIGLRQEALGDVESP